MAQLKSTNVVGNLSVTGNILASKIIKLGGTSTQILMADGSTMNAPSADLGTVTSVGVTSSSLTVTGSPITSSGTITIEHPTATATTADIYKIGKDNKGHVVIGDKITPADLGLSKVYKYKGTKTWAELLALTKAEIGDVYSITNKDPDGNTNADWACCKAVSAACTTSNYSTYWQSLGGKVDLSGYTEGATSSTDNAIVRFDGTSGKKIQNSTATISDKGHLSIDTTSDSTMTTPAVNILHTGPKDGTSYADLMILSGFSQAPYGFKFRTYGDGTAIIQSQRIGNDSDTFPLSLNPNGKPVLINGHTAWHAGNDGSGSGLDADLLDGKHAISSLTATDNDNIPTSKAVADYIDGLGYVTGSYLPLAGGEMKGPIDFEDKANASGKNKNYISAGGGYGATSGLEGLKILALNQSNARMGMGIDLTGGSYELTVATGRADNNTASKIGFATHTTGTTAYKTLGYFTASGKENPDVTFNVVGTIQENGTALSSKYLGINAKAADSSKLDGKTATTTLGSDNTTIPTSKAVTTYVTGLLEDLELGDSYQPLDADLTAIAELGDSATTGLLRKSGKNSWKIDSNTYLKPGDNASASYLAFFKDGKQVSGSQNTHCDGVGNIKAASYGIYTDVANNKAATWQYNSSTDCVELMWN